MCINDIINFYSAFIHLMDLIQSLKVNVQVEFLEDQWFKLE